MRDLQLIHGLIEIDGCVFDRKCLSGSFGFKSLDPVGQEAFVNHVHFDTPDRKQQAESRLLFWESEMKSQWPDREFRVYVQEEPDEITIRFHQVRFGISNWCEASEQGITIETIGS